MYFWSGLVIALTLVLAALITLAVKFAFPYHRFLALFLYGASWIPFLYSISLHRKWIASQHDVVVSFFSAFWLHIVFASTVLGMTYAFLVLFPVAKSPFLNLDNSTISKKIQEDAMLFYYLDDRLSYAMSSAKEEGIFLVPALNASAEEKKKIKDFLIAYVEVMIELDLFKERYKTFYQLNLLNQKEQHVQAFKVGYAAFLAQHYYTIEFSKLIEDHHMQALVNEKVESHGISHGTYDRMVQKLTDSDELLRLSTGNAYYRVVEQTSKGKLDEIILTYLDGVNNSQQEYVQLVVEKPLAFLEKETFKVWFPVQKQSAIHVSFIRAAKRDYHITPQQIQSYKDRFQPGDILLERREWHATNVGIPGFWTHSALYMGTLEEMERTFEGLPQLEGQTFKEYVQKTYPNVYAELLLPDKDGYLPAVIESKRPGVITISLEASTKADSLAVLRVPGLTREDQFKIVTQAMQHFGKEYDFDFNFVTDNEMVCSELVYKSFDSVAELGLLPKEFNSRSVISPNQFAEKFAQDQESFALILFLDGNEKERKAVEKDEAIFAETWSRPKWHIAQDYMRFE